MTTEPRCHHSKRFFGLRYIPGIRLEYASRILSGRCVSEKEYEIVGKSVLVSNLVLSCQAVVRMKALWIYAIVHDMNFLRLDVDPLQNALLLILGDSDHTFT